MILIGNVFRGPEHQASKTKRLLSKLMELSMELRGLFEVGDCPAVNVVFYVPGSLGAFDWDGIRDAKFSKQQKLLMVQVAVPANMIDSPSLKDELIESLHGANAVAFEFFRQKGMQFPLADAEDLVLRIKDRMEREPST
jgi:hypothetical protein